MSETAVEGSSVRMNRERETTSACSASGRDAEDAEPGCPGDDEQDDADRGHQETELQAVEHRHWPVVKRMRLGLALIGRPITQSIVKAAGSASDTGENPRCLAMPITTGSMMMVRIVLLVKKKCDTCSRQ